MLLKVKWARLCNEIQHFPNFHHLLLKQFKDSRGLRKEAYICRTAPFTATIFISVCGVYVCSTFSSLIADIQVNMLVQKLHPVDVEKHHQLRMASPSTNLYLVECLWTVSLMNNRSADSTEPFHINSPKMSPFLSNTDVYTEFHPLQWNLSHLAH